jgi:hypothetical protein
MTKDKAKKLIVPPALQFTPTRLRHTTKGERMIEEDDDTQVYKKPWVGLTDEEVEKLDCVQALWQDEGECEIHGVKEFYRNIEAKLKEKNT